MHPVLIVREIRLVEEREIVDGQVVLAQVFQIREDIARQLLAKRESDLK